MQSLNKISAQISNYISCHVTPRHVMSCHVMSVTRYTPVSWTFCQRLQRVPVQQSHPANTCRDS